MSHRRVLRTDLVAGGLFLAGLLVALCVLSYQPADLPEGRVFPPNDKPANLLGAPGALVADVLFDALGASVYVLLAVWFVLVVVLLLRQSRVRWSLRLVGWLLLLPCAAAVAEYVGPGRLGYVEGPENGGGSLGAWLVQALERFTPPVQGALAGGCLLLGLILSIDFLLLRLLKGGWWLFGQAWRGVGLLRRATGRGTRRMLSASGRALRAAAPKRRVPPAPVTEPPIEEPAPMGEAARSTVKEPVPGPQSPKVPEPQSPPADEKTIPIHYHTRPPSAADVSEALTVARLPGGDGERFADYELPPLTLLEDSAPFPAEQHDQKLREQAALLEKTFSDFGVNVRVVGINTGPVVTQYEVALETGLRVHKVTGMADDIALNLKVPSVRMVAPIPGKNAVGVEVPNEHRAVVQLREVIQTGAKRAARAKLPLFLGKDTEGRPLIYDLAEMPHLLIAGRTGTGKSVCMNAVILSILMTRRPDEVKMVMIDPKMLELSEYGKIPHLMHPIVKDMRKAEAILAWAVDKMEERYDLLSRARVRNIAGYNELSREEVLRRVDPDEEEKARIPDRMPYIIVFVDEMGDLMMTMKKEVEGHIIRLAQKSRAAGIHLVVATQKPTVDVITGLIKSNLPARICFQVSSRSDSRVVLDEMGADKLLGKGDMLFLQPGTGTLIRAQGTYAGDDEIRKVTEFLECDPCYAEELIRLKTDGDGKGGLLETLRARDDLYEPAVEVIVREGRGSVSLLQRSLGIGYGRAARLIDFMAEDGIVGAYNGSNARDVLYTPEQWAELKSGAEA